MANKASAANIISPGGWSEPLVHGGDLAAARRLFPNAPEPFVDLSTGINPNPYHVSRLTGDVFTRLPDAAASVALAEAAARAYAAASAAHVTPAPGTQILLPLVAGLARPGRAAIFPPTYGEFARAAALAGHTIMETRSLTDARDCALVFIGNPNNPDGRVFARRDLLTLADQLRPRGGLLVVDEAFMEVGPLDESLAPDVGRGNIVVLRSFGKFFGLAGVRLGFALAAPSIATRLLAQLGPWAVSGPALAIGTKALADTAWIETTRSRLAKAAKRLDGVLSGTLTCAGLKIIGGTSLFRLAQIPAAGELFHHLGRAGILVRAFPEQPEWLRFGLPANKDAWRRLQTALAAFRAAAKLAP
jgi:cobalamin biosynthesis protein CobC